MDEGFRLFYMNMVHSSSWVRECKMNAKHGRQMEGYKYTGLVQEG